jgi:hypothetical protein
LKDYEKLIQQRYTGGLDKMNNNYSPNRNTSSKYTDDELVKDPSSRKKNQKKFKEEPKNKHNLSPDNTEEDLVAPYRQEGKNNND